MKSSLFTNGLCNRLSVMFALRKINGRVNFRWVDNDQCGGRFHDCFESIEGVDITYDAEPYYDGRRPGKLVLAEFEFLYRDLRPVLALRKRVAENVAKMGGKFVAVHYRGTDLLPWMRRKRKPTTTTGALMDFIDTCDPSLQVWLATDDPTVPALFRERYGDRLHCHSFDESLTDENRKTSLADSVVDIYTCVMAEHFAGSYGSTFSRFIRQHRNLLSRRQIRELCLPDAEVFP